RPDHIIAMHGPFTKELNEAVMEQYEIRHLITKDGGVSGGFPEKIEAARNAGVSVHVITRPAVEEGVSVSKACRIVTGKFTEAKTETKTDKASLHSSYSPRITLVGTGMGAATGLTVEAINAIENADMVFGAERLLQSVKGIFGQSDICDKNLIAKYRAEDIIPILEEQRPDIAAIVFSGDTGFYSGAKGMEQKLKAWRQDCNIRILPGISSVSCLAARLGETYEDAVLLSLHGKNSAQDIGVLADQVRCNGKVFVLLSGAEDVRRIAEKLKEADVEAKIIAGMNLSYENESIRHLSLKEASGFEGEGVISLMIRNSDPVRRELLPVKNDEQFIREKIPMTKACIRHESLIRLGLRQGDIFYDIGGGTGSVAIEAAGLDPDLQVTTIERKAEAADLIRENVKRFGLSNVTVVEGAAESVLPAMKKPDCVFIGGSGGKLSEIVSLLREKGEGIRFVITAVSLETIEQIRKVMEAYGIENEKETMISVTQVAKTGEYHMLKAENPVWIFSFTL
ncbi:MAG: precorrin-6y C5,15-methyltransferase (decarboxylating) subunit CbiE, partial [Lachnospiraceae bacterium]|nr:precorrin-6y C5,15-methyltransferase (decarboxylating) subunit CbiE [Lachnospiraceae bacterium]